MWIKVFSCQSRLVKNETPYFLWTIKRDIIDYHSLSCDQMLNHYGKTASFTTKVSGRAGGAGGAAPCLLKCQHLQGWESHTGTGSLGAPLQDWSLLLAWPGVSVQSRSELLPANRPPQSPCAPRPVSLGGPKATEALSSGRTGQAQDRAGDGCHRSLTQALGPGGALDPRGAGPPSPAL